MCSQWLQCCQVAPDDTGTSRTPPGVNNDAHSRVHTEVSLPGDPAKALSATPGALRRKT